MVQGVDVWLGTSRRPLEASGIGSQKAVFNGALNLAIQDGWWDEAYDGSNGFAIGWGRIHVDDAENDRCDAVALYEALETRVVPTYYDRHSDGLPGRWIKMMMNSISTLAWRFNSHRMVMDHARRYYLPAAKDISEAEALLDLGVQVGAPAQKGRNSMNAPIEIRDSLKRFRQDYPDATKVAFIMMQFGKTPAHDRIVASLKTALSKHGIVALRADEKWYHDELYWNVLTYIHGCRFAIAVFERIEADDFNPNVSLEVGYVFAVRKPVCLLKDKTLRRLPTDLVGKLYREFDSQDPEVTIPRELEFWLRDKEVI
jgi:hypothetical protein